MSSSPCPLFLLRPLCCTTVVSELMRLLNTTYAHYTLTHTPHTPSAQTRPITIHTQTNALGDYNRCGASVWEAGDKIPVRRPNIVPRGNRTRAGRPATALRDHCSSMRKNVTRCPVYGEWKITPLFLFVWWAPTWRRKPIKTCHSGKHKEEPRSSISRELRDWRDSLIPSVPPLTL